MSLVGAVIQGFCVEGTPLPPDSLEMWAMYTALWQEVRALLEVEVDTHNSSALYEAYEREGEVEPAWMMKVGNYQYIALLEACSAVH
jgi:hypothetical protein